MIVRHHRASAFGLRWDADIALDGFDQDDTTHAEATVSVSRTDHLADRTPCAEVNGGEVYADGFRFDWEREATFDMVDGDRIAYRPGPDWRGALPWAFYGTVTALTLAWRGMIPFHACAVEVDGRAILIAGPPGAGKSSLTSGLIEQGALFFSDDLSVASGPGDHTGVALLRGRPTMRQHADTAARIDAEHRAPIMGDPRGKWLVLPRARSTRPVLPLAGVILLTPAPLASGGAIKLDLLARHLFRPRWLTALPNHAVRRRELMMIAAVVPIAGFPAISAFDPAAQHCRAKEAMALIAAFGNAP